MESLESLRAMAERCRRLALTCSDREASEKLAALAVEYEARVAVAEAAEAPARMQHN